jgi:hypothetical protein
VLEGLSTNFSGRTKGMFVRYGETSKAYKIFIPAHRKTVVSRDVKFEKDFASRETHMPLVDVLASRQELPHRSSV